MLTLGEEGRKIGGRDASYRRAHDAQQPMNKDGCIAAEPFENDDQKLV